MVAVTISGTNKVAKIPKLCTESVKKLILCYLIYGTFFRLLFDLWLQLTRYCCVLRYADLGNIYLDMYRERGYNRY